MQQLLCTKALCFVSIIFCFAAQHLSAQIVSEAMPAPAGDCPEFVELNTWNLPTDFHGTSATVSLSDKSKTIEFDIAKVPGFVVVCKDTTSLFHYAQRFDSVQYVEASLPSLNNSGDNITISVFSEMEDYEEAVEYASDVVVEGVSWERSTEQEVLLCKLPIGHTCGILNTHTAIPYDVYPLSIRFGNNAFYVEVTNAGMRSVSDIHTTILVKSTTQTIYATSASDIGVGESKTLQVQAALSTTSVAVVVSVTHANNKRRYNDTLQTVVSSPNAPAAIVINELLFEPHHAQVEAIELYNSTDAPIQLRNWILCDAEKQSGRDSVEILEPFVLREQSYCTVVWDGERQDTTIENTVFATGALTLNNDEDEIVLYDPAGTTIDSLVYKRSWHTPALQETEGISLERLAAQIESWKPTSWASSAHHNGHTLGKKNSRWLKPPEDGTLTVSPQLWSEYSAPDGLLIQYDLPFSAAQLTIQLFSEHGVLAADVSQVQISSGKESLLWNPVSSSVHPLRPGIYILVLQARSVDTQEFIQCSTIVGVE